MVRELFVSGDEVWCQGDGGMEPLREGAPLVASILERVRVLYPSAYEALRTVYSRSSANTRYYSFLMARRFCKCNFASLDHTRSDIADDMLSLERVSCPLQGECPYEGVICEPVLETRLSDAEKRVMRLVVDGRGNKEIAEELYLSPNTVKRHISTAYAKTGVRNRADFVRYARDNQIFK